MSSFFCIVSYNDKATEMNRDILIPSLYEQLVVGIAGNFLVMSKSVLR